MARTRGRVAPRLVTSVVIAAALIVGSSSSAFAAGGEAKSDPGIGSAAALAGPNCDPTTKRLKIPFYAAPPCVKPWNDGDDNGGATAQGATKGSIKVVILWADLAEQTAQAGNIINQATAKAGNEPDSIVDTDAMFQSTFETWGRTIEYAFVKSTGIDEAAQRADAVKVAAMKPFAAIDFASVYLSGGGIVFESALRNKVPAIISVPCCGVIPPRVRQNPLVSNAAEWVGKALVGRKAKWAGDDSLKSKTRVFGVVYPGGDNGIDFALFTTEFAKRGGKVASSVSYTTGADPLRAPTESVEQAPTFITRLKSAGVTTVVNFADGLAMTPALTKAATAQDYFPEWVITGSGYQDQDIVARASDQKQMAHAFGLVWFSPYVASAETTSAFQWYWGKDKGTMSGGALGLLLPLYTGVHLAGPKLTATTFERALVAYPPTGGAFSDQVTTLENSWTAFGTMAPRGSALGWWSSDTVGPSQSLSGAGSGPGKYLYLQGGKRFVVGTFPKAEPKFFDESASIAQLDAVPPPEQTPTYPCNDCPSSGGGPAPSTNAAT
jgi:hypothetical protein